MRFGELEVVEQPDTIKHIEHDYWGVNNEYLKALNIYQDNQDRRYSSYTFFTKDNYSVMLEKIEKSQEALTALELKEFLKPSKIIRREEREVVFLFDITNLTPLSVYFNESRDLQERKNILRQILLILDEVISKDFLFTKLNICNIFLDNQNNIKVVPFTIRKREIFKVGKLSFPDDISSQVYFTGLIATEISGLSYFNDYINNLCSTWLYREWFQSSLICPLSSENLIRMEKQKIRDEESKNKSILNFFRKDIKKEKVSRGSLNFFQSARAPFSPPFSKSNQAYGSYGMWLEKCLARNFRDRYQTPKEALEALAKVKCSLWPWEIDLGL